MTEDKMKIVVSILKEFSDGNIPSAAEYKISNEEYGNIIDAMQDKGLIKGAKFSRGGKGNKILITYDNNVKITMNGMEFLKNSSPLIKATEE